MNIWGFLFGDKKEAISDLEIIIGQAQLWNVLPENITTSKPKV